MLVSKATKKNGLPDQRQPATKLTTIVDFNKTNFYKFFRQNVFISSYDILNYQSPLNNHTNSLI